MAVRQTLSVERSTELSVEMTSKSRAGWRFRPSHLILGVIVMAAAVLTMLIVRPSAEAANVEQARPSTEQGFSLVSHKEVAGIPTRVRAVTEGRFGATPSLSLLSDRHGIVTPGDLHQVDTGLATSPTVVYLRLSNYDELLKRYESLEVTIGVYQQGLGGQWARVGNVSSKQAGHLGLTTSNSAVAIRLAPGARYGLTVESGTFATYDKADRGSMITPQFSLQCRDDEAQPHRVDPTLA